MAAPYSSLPTKLESAMKTVAEAVSSTDRGGALVSTGLAGDDLLLPAVVVIAEAGEEYPYNSGNFNLTATVEVHSDADKSLDEHRSRTGYVLDAFMDGSLAIQLSAAGSDFTCFGVHSRQMLGERQEERHWVSGLQFAAYVCGSDVS